MLMNMQRLLRIANENHFAIPAFNIGSLVMLNAVMECCEEEQAPVIIAIHSSLRYSSGSFWRRIHL